MRKASKLELDAINEVATLLKMFDVSADIKPVLLPTKTRFCLIHYSTPCDGEVRTDALGKYTFNSINALKSAARRLIGKKQELDGHL